MVKQITTAQMNALLREIKHREGILEKISQEGIKKTSIIFSIADETLTVTGQNIRHITKAMTYARLSSEQKKGITITKTLKKEVTC